MLERLKACKAMLEQRGARVRPKDMQCTWSPRGNEQRGRSWQGQGGDGPKCVTPVGP